MGYNSVLFVCNDVLCAIEDAPKEFARELVRRMGSGTTGEFGFGCHGNGLSIPHIDHADITALISVGGNHAKRLASVREHHSGDGKVALLKVLAHELGYTVTKGGE